MHSVRSFDHFRNSIGMAGARVKSSFSALAHQDKLQDNLFVWKFPFHPCLFFCFTIWADALYACVCLSVIVDVVRIFYMIVCLVVGARWQVECISSARRCYSVICRLAATPAPCLLGVEWSHEADKPVWGADRSHILRYVGPDSFTKSNNKKKKGAGRKRWTLWSDLGNCMAS